MPRFSGEPFVIFFVIIFFGLGAYCHKTLCLYIHARKCWLLFFPYSKSFRCYRLIWGQFIQYFALALIGTSTSKLWNWFPKLVEAHVSNWIGNMEQTRNMIILF